MNNADRVLGLMERRDWMRVSVMHNVHGTFDVVLRLDGSYAYQESAEGVADHFAVEFNLPRERDLGLEKAPDE